MRQGWQAITAVALGLAAGAAAMAAAQPDDSFSGHYYRLPPAKVKGKLVWPARNDIVDIAPVGRDHAYVRIDTRLNGKDCRFAGVARYEAYELVYRELGGDPNTSCLLAITAEDGRLEWEDNGRCRARCPSGGMSGSIPFAHRGRPASAAALGYRPGAAGAE